MAFRFVLFDRKRTAIVPVSVGDQIAGSKQYELSIASPAPCLKATNPEVFEKALAAINHMRDPADPIKPIETIMAEDTIGNLQGAKKAGMQTVWVPRRAKGIPNHPSRKLQKKLASVDHIYATPHQFLDALHAAIHASGEAPLPL